MCVLQAQELNTTLTAQKREGIIAWRICTLKKLLKTRLPLEPCLVICAMRHHTPFWKPRGCGQDPSTPLSALTGFHPPCSL